MELLELLEKRIDALLAEIERLRSENSTLQTELLACKNQKEENNKYIDTLKEEQENTELVRNKIEVLMQKIEDVLTK